MRTAVGTLAAVLLGCMLPVHAQAPAVYRVEFEISDGAAKAGQPPRHFTMVIDESRKGVFQAGNRVPARNTSSSPFIDVGAKIECSVRGQGDQVALEGTIEMSEVTGNICVGECEPIIGQRKMVFHTAVELGKPIVIASADKQEVTATVAQLP